jgi:LuxR family transcriptional regulator, maltose regulon positive regulatory protein
VRGNQYLDLLERAQPPVLAGPRLTSRFATMRSVHHALMGQADQAIDEALAARAIQEPTPLTDEWTATVPMILMSAYEWLEDYPAVEREAAEALATAELTEPAKLVVVPGARALAWFEAGRLAEAAAAATAAEKQARRLGFGQHFFAADYLRVLAGLALERRDLDTAELLAEQALSLCERGRAAFEFLALLDQARISATRGRVRDALASIEAARLVLAATGSALLARADELEAVLRLSAGDPSTPVKLARGLPAAHGGLLLARIALATGDYHGAWEHLRALPSAQLTPRHVLVRQILLAAVAIGRGDPTAAGSVGGVLESARHGGFLNTVVTTAPQVTSYLIEHSAQMRPGPFTQQLITAALEVDGVVKP